MYKRKPKLVKTETNDDPITFIIYDKAGAEYIEFETI